MWLNSTPLPTVAEVRSRICCGRCRRARNVNARLYPDGGWRCAAEHAESGKGLRGRWGKRPAYGHLIIPRGGRRARRNKRCRSREGVCAGTASETGRHKIVVGSIGERAARDGRGGDSRRRKHRGESDVESFLRGLCCLRRPAVSRAGSEQNSEGRVQSHGCEARAACRESRAGTAIGFVRCLHSADCCRSSAQ